MIRMHFSNAICFIVFLFTGKWVKFSLYLFCFFRKWFWWRQRDPFGTKIDKFNFIFKKSGLWVFSPRIWNVSWMRLSSPELKAQVSFSDRPVSVVRPSVCPSVTNSHIFIFFSRTTAPISVKLGTKHPWVKGI